MYLRLQLFVVLLLAVVSRATYNSSTEPRFSHSKYTSITKFPHAAFVLKTNFRWLFTFLWDFACGATIIKNRGATGFVSKMWVVTVASCLYSGNKVSDNDQFKVVINTEYIHGPLGSQSNGFNVDHVIPHPGFNMSDARSRNENNIGLLRLQNRLWVTGLTKEALIENWWDPRLQLQKIYVAGWGSERDLESYTKQISSHVFVALPNSQCKYYYNYKLYDETRHFCGYFEDNRQPCSGDQGDGMVVHDPQAGGWVLVGIVHHHNGTGCTTKYEHESIIVIRISGFYHWINGAIKKVDKEWPMTG